MDERDFSNGMKRYSAFHQSRAGKDASIVSVCKGLDALGQDWAAAESDGTFVPLPDQKPERSADSSRMRTIRNRLFMLGYMEADSGRGNLDGPLEAAIAAFQQEAGLEVDGWVGEQETWPALQELVSFETRLDPLKWFRKGKPMKALLRAVGLRLFVLGLLPENPAGGDFDREQAMRRFGDIWQRVGLKMPAASPGFNLGWLWMLFDQDRIVEQLGALKALPGKKDLERTHSFILNAAKIELWLMGYKVVPNGYDLEQRKVRRADADGMRKWDLLKLSRTLTQYYFLKKSFNLYKALCLFWKDNGEKEETAEALSVDFLGDFPRFFAFVNSGLLAHEAMTDDQKQIRIEAFISTKKHKRDIPAIWHSVKTLGGRIWDGMRRIWGWFTRMLQTAKAKILKIGLNLSRLIYNFALQSFTVVANVFKSIGAVIDVLVHSCVSGAENRKVSLWKDGDFDLCMLVDDSAGPQEIRQCCSAIAHKVGLFSFGCRVLATIVRLLANAFETAWTGYFGLVSALIKFRGTRHRLQSLVNEYALVFGGADR